MAGAGRNDDLSEFISALERYCQEDNQEPEEEISAPSIWFSNRNDSLNHIERIEKLVLPVCEGIRLYGSGDYMKAAKILLGTRPSWHKLGLSNTHLDTLELTFIHALARGAGVAADDSLSFSENRENQFLSFGGLRNQLNAFGLGSPDNEVPNENSSRLSSRSPPQLLNLALARAMMSDRVSRRKLCPQSHLLYAKILHDAGARDQAIAAYRKALDLGMGQGGKF
eukprot:CAMPEP_0184015204 /NCGR_PEP_ID=MMETSP0954-20121128/6160_1 /TAXON_ID=627963 /ORGANISM="Aplanochytrium sp, Strain PBS07" /LENGTH=224 /DNA_ID=CAMNT_0026295921 /DNA_START=187 /DNA_END=861 /DNA_ORIENTATION=+